MVYLKTPEFSSKFGAVDDLAFTDGSPVSAHVLREMARNGNRLISKGDLLFRWVGAEDDGTGESTSAGSSFAPPFWQYAIPVFPFPVLKRKGITQIRVRVRADIDSGLTLLFYVGTLKNPTPTPLATSNILTMAGTGSLAAYTKNDIEVREPAGEVLSFFYKYSVDPSSDALMNTATYGSPSAGTSSYNTGPFWFSDTGTPATWNTTTAEVHEGGHYVQFLDSNSVRETFIGEIRGVVSATQLLFWPECPNSQLIRGAKYQILKLPACKFVSIAVYGVDRT